LDMCYGFSTFFWLQTCQQCTFVQATVCLRVPSSTYLLVCAAPHPRRRARRPFLCACRACAVRARACVRPYVARGWNRCRRTLGYVAHTLAWTKHTGFKLVPSKNYS
jgi:hypothetical protein